MGRIPEYRKMYAAIKREIQAGNYKPGMLLPTESELEKQFSVSRTTVRRAVSLLSAEGYLSVRQGRGTEILDISTTQKLNHISSITETLRERGYKVTTQGMCIELVPASEDVAKMLGIPENQRVYRLQRVQCADGLPIAIMLNYLRENAVPGFEKYADTFTGLYEFLEKRYNLILQDAWEWISAVAASFTESQILRVPVGSPLLCSRRVTNLPQGPFEYSVIKLVADKYEYSVYMEGRG